MDRLGRAGAGAAPLGAGRAGTLQFRLIMVVSGHSSRFAGHCAGVARGRATLPLPLPPPAPACCGRHRTGDTLPRSRAARYRRVLCGRRGCSADQTNGHDAALRSRRAFTGNRHDALRPRRLSLCATAGVPLRPTPFSLHHRLPFYRRRACHLPPTHVHAFARHTAYLHLPLRTAATRLPLRLSPLFLPPPLRIPR